MRHLLSRVSRWSTYGIAGLSLALAIGTGALWYRNAAAGHGDSLRFLIGFSRATVPPGSTLAPAGTTIAQERAVTFGTDESRLYVFYKVMPARAELADAPLRLRSRFYYSDYTNEYLRPSWAMRSVRPGYQLYDQVWERAGFKFATDTNRTWAMAFRYFHAPLWCLCIILALPGLVVALRGIRKWRRHAAGHCRVCGYDLRGTPDRCPECGTSVSPVATHSGAAPLPSADAG